MSTYNLPSEPEWIVKSRKAAYCARRRLNGADLTVQDMEDMIQSAALAYWKFHRQGRPSYIPCGPFVSLFAVT